MDENRTMLSAIWLLMLTCLLHSAATKDSDGGGNLLVDANAAAGQRVRLHELSASQYAHIARLMNRTPAISQARLITSDVPASRTLTTSTTSDDSGNTGFFSNPSFMNLLRIIRFNITDSSKSTDSASTPLCVIKVSDKEVAGRAASDSNVKCVVVVKDKKVNGNDRNGLAAGWDPAMWGGGGHDAWPGAGWNPGNWGDDNDDNNDDKFDKFDDNVDYKPVYKPFYRPFYVPQSYQHGHHSHSHGRNVAASQKRKASSADALRQYEIDQYVRQALRDYNAQKAQSNDDANLQPNTETMQMPPNMPAPQFGPFSPYGIYGSLYNPALHPNLYQSAARKPPSKKAKRAEAAPNFNYQLMPSYLRNPFENVNVAGRSNKHFAIAAVDEEDNNHYNNDNDNGDDDDDGADDDDNDNDDEVEADDY